MIHQLPPLLIAGALMLCAFYLGKIVKLLRLPTLIGYMLAGLLFGPSLLNVVSESVQADFSFITEIALSFVAVSIGLELSLSSLKRQGKGIVTLIFAESLLAFAVVSGAVYLLTRDLPMALIFGALAPASAPAGTVAVIHENRSKGKLTDALYAVVGFDDGLGIIIFGFASAIVQGLLQSEIGGQIQILTVLLEPLKEVVLSVVVGASAGWLFSFLAHRLRNKIDTLILLIASVLTIAGLCSMLHLSEILTNMIFGIIIINTQSSKLVHSLKSHLETIMPVTFVLFFALAGANLHINALPALGLLGAVYIVARSVGLVGGSIVGATLGKLSSTIRNYVGLGILSQAGVAIGLSLIVKQELSTISAHGAEIGSTVITTITATCIFFEIIGPILTKIGLKRAGEITVPDIES
ncbi:MAG: cation:proton antiporter [Spirochaetota bacterium]